MLEKLPKPFEIWQVEEMLQMKLRSTDAVLLLELQLFNRLVERIRETLQLLRQVSIFRVCRSGVSAAMVGDPNNVGEQSLD